MSMYVAYQLPHALAGVIALSGYLPQYDNFKNVRMHTYSLLTRLDDHQRSDRNPVTHILFSTNYR